MSNDEFMQALLELWEVDYFAHGPEDDEEEWFPHLRSKETEKYKETGDGKIIVPIESPWKNKRKEKKNVE